MKAFADWDPCDLHENTDMVMGESVDVGMVEPCWEQGAALHKTLLSSRLECISDLCVFPAIIAQIHGSLGNLLNLNYLHSLF